MSATKSTLAVVVVWTLGVGGCASVLGIEEQTFDGADAGEVSGDADGTPNDNEASGFDVAGDAPTMFEASAVNPTDASTTDVAGDANDASVDVSDAASATKSSVIDEGAPDAVEASALDASSDVDADAGPVIGCAAGTWSNGTTVHCAMSGPGTLCAGDAMTCSCIEMYYVNYGVCFSETGANSNPAPSGCVEDAGAVYLSCP
jgi:hypothetical protein